MIFFFFFSSRRRHTRSTRDWSSDVCSSDLQFSAAPGGLSAGSLPLATFARSQPDLVDDSESELLTDVVEPGGVGEGLPLVVGSHIQVGVDLQDHRVGMDALETAEAAERGRMFATNHDGQPR